MAQPTPPFALAGDEAAIIRAQGIVARAIAIGHRIGRLLEILHLSCPRGSRRGPCGHEALQRCSWKPYAPHVSGVTEWPAGHPDSAGERLLQVGHDWWNQECGVAQEMDAHADRQVARLHVEDRHDNGSRQCAEYGNDAEERYV